MPFCRKYLRAGETGIGKFPSIDSQSLIPDSQSRCSVIAPMLSYASVWYVKGIALNGLGRFEEALQACDKALELSPDYTNIWLVKGIALTELGRYEEAQIAFKSISLT